MPLRAADLVQLAEAGQSTANLARVMAEGALALSRQARAGQLTLDALVDGLDDLFLGHNVVLSPYEQQFERVLLHYNSLRLRVNANTARRMKELRDRQKRATAGPLASDYRHQLSLFEVEATEQALAAESAISDDEAIFGPKTGQ